MRGGDERDRDMSPASIVILTVVCLIASAWLAFSFISGTPIADYSWTLVLVAIPFVLIGGFVIAAICGYMAGLIGASNSPVSGVGILSIVSCATILLLVVDPTEAMRPALVAFALFVTAIIFACATISNDNLQDLKTGQLVGASPRRQQIALIVGVIAGSIVIPPILNLLAQSNGFAGAPNLNTISSNPLPAPQATLISALAMGVIGGSLDWKMMGIGALVGVGLVLLDETLGLLKRLRIPPLAVGIGIYLPMSATFAVVVGAVISHWYNTRTAKGPNAVRAERLGTLVASGLIVGEGLWGVLNSGLVVATQNDAPIGLVAADFGPANIIGVVSFAGLIVLLYRWMLVRTERASSA
jgi:putative OPT family oligopeptide transporter